MHPEARATSPPCPARATSALTLAPAGAGDPAASAVPGATPGERRRRLGEQDHLPATVNVQDPRSWVSAGLPSLFEDDPDTVAVLIFDIEDRTASARDDGVLDFGDLLPG